MIAEGYLSRSRLYRRLRNEPHGELIELYAVRLAQALIESEMLLIVDHRINRFVCDLQAALERAGSDVLVVRSAGRAVAFLQHFNFSAVLVGDLANPPEEQQWLLEEAGSVPVLRYGGSMDVPGIVQALAAFEALGLKPSTRFH